MAIKISGSTIIDDSRNIVSAGVITATTINATVFVGDGSGLIGVVGSGSGVVLLDDDAAVGTAATINLGTGLVASTISAGIVTVSSYIAGIDTSGSSEFNQLNVSGVSTFSGDIKTNGSNVVLGFSGSATDDRITWNTDSAEVYADTSRLYLKSQLANGINIFGTGTIALANYNGTKTYLLATEDGSVDLYHNNSKKFETLGAGVTVTGTTFTNQLSVSGVTTFGPGLSGNDGDIDLQHNGATRAYWDGSAGTLNFKDGSGVTFGDTDDVSMYWDGTDFYLTKNTVAGSIKFTKSTGNETIAVFSNDGPVELYYDNSKKFETTSSGVNIVGTTTTGQLSVTGFTTFNYAVKFNTSTDFIQIDSPNNRMLFRDSHSLFFGNGNDLELVHDGSTTRITNGGPLIIRNNSISGVTSISGSTVGTIADFTQSGEVRIPGQLLVGSGGTVVTTTSSGSVGIGTTNPQSSLQVERYGVETGIGTFSAIVGVAHTIDSFALATKDFDAAEYLIHIENGSSVQTQKSIVMIGGATTTAYSQEYAVIYNNTHLVSLGATVSSGTCNVTLTPSSGVSGITTYKFKRGALL